MLDCLCGRRDPRGGSRRPLGEDVAVPDVRPVPEVEVARDEVRIGEAGNLATLKKDEWNVLVAPIQSGQLSKV